MSHKLKCLTISNMNPAQDVVQKTILQGTQMEVLGALDVDTENVQTHQLQDYHNALFQQTKAHWGL